MENEIADTRFEIQNDIEDQEIISLNKFVILSVLSFGLYQIWWTYKAWRFFKQKEKSDIMPVCRAIFSIFFLHSLFEKILYYAKEKEYEETYSPTVLFIGFLLAYIASRMPEPISFISFFSFLLIIPPFKALNFAKLRSNEFIVTELETFNGKQIALMIFGGLLWILVLFGLNSNEY